MKIGIVGAAGRMGRMLVAEILATDGAELAGGVDAQGCAELGRDLGALAGRDPVGIAVGDDLDQLFAVAEAVIDCATPATALLTAERSGARGVPLVVGTTGLDLRHMDALRSAARTACVVQSYNMSIGVNLLLGLARQVAGILGPDYDVEIVEMHHRHKVDAPSGTALAIGRAVADGRGVDLETVSQRVRDGHTGPRRRGDIGFAALRGGDVVGDHTLIFAAEGERVEFTHKASSRAVFARGMVRAALWTRGRGPGFHSMRDVLGFE